MSEYNIQMNKYNALSAGYDQLYPATKIENVDGLNTALQNKASKATEDIVMSTTYPSYVGVSVSASELQAYLDALPKMLTKRYAITVSGTCSSDVKIQSFYGSGSIEISAENIGGCIFSGHIVVDSCGVKVTIAKLRFNLPASSSAAGIRASNSILVSVQNCEFIGENGNQAVGVGTDGHAVIGIAYCKFQNLYIAVHLYRGGLIYVNCNADDVSNNSYGIYSYYGGIAQLLGSTPNTVGGGSNYKNGGGAIINAAGQFI